MMRRVFHAAVAATLVGWAAHGASTNDTFDTLRVGSIAYSNVQIRGRTGTDVYFRHSRGFANVKVDELPPEVQLLLGYEPEPERRGPIVLDLGRLKADPRIQAIREQWAQRLEGSVLKLDPMQLAGVVLAGVMVFLFFSYCSLLICRNAGSKPGFWVWVPVLQLLPLLRAARMSGWWFLAFFLPVLNIAATLVWGLKIAEACGKPALVGVLFLVPGVNLAAMLYLAFSAAPLREAGLEPIKLNLGEA